jgi:hypothetical protein
MRFRFQPRQNWTLDRVSHLNIYSCQQRRPLQNYLSIPSRRAIYKQNRQSDLSCQEMANPKFPFSRSITFDPRRSNEENSRRRPTSSLSPSPAAWILLRRAALSLRGRGHCLVFRDCFATSLCHRRWNRHLRLHRRGDISRTGAGHSGMCERAGACTSCVTACAPHSGRTMQQPLPPASSSSDHGELHRWRRRRATLQMQSSSRCHGAPRGLN